MVKASWKEAKLGGEARDKIAFIYRQHNLPKLKALNELISKHGADKLLAAVKKKYADCATEWTFCLKNYETGPDAKWKNQEIRASLEHVRPKLDELAESIGGECVEDHGKRRMVVRGKSPLSRIDAIESTVTFMQKELIRKRRRKTAISPSLAVNEHERRKAEKAASLSRKNVAEHQSLNKGDYRNDKAKKAAYSRQNCGRKKREERKPSPMRNLNELHHETSAPKAAKGNLKSKRGGKRPKPK